MLVDDHVLKLVIHLPPSLGPGPSEEGARGLRAAHRGKFAQKPSLSRTSPRRKLGQVVGRSTRDEVIITLCIGQSRELVSVRFD